MLVRFHLWLPASVLCSLPQLPHFFPPFYPRHSPPADGTILTSFERAFALRAAAEPRPK